jgi:hypothetical protein
MLKLLPWIMLAIILLTGEIILVQVVMHFPRPDSLTMARALLERNDNPSPETENHLTQVRDTAYRQRTLQIGIVSLLLVLNTFAVIQVGKKMWRSARRE